MTQERSAGEERARLFVALELPERVRRALVTWRSRAVGELPALRPIAPERLHATLCFLGWRQAGEIEAIVAACHALGAQAQAVPNVRFLADAIWLPARRPRVLAVALGDPEGRLAGVQLARCHQGRSSQPIGRRPLDLDGEVVNDLVVLVLGVGEGEAALGVQPRYGQKV